MSVLLIALIGTLLGGFFLKLLENRLAGPKVISGDTNKTHRKSRRLELKNPLASAYDCVMYSTRLFEQKLVDEGVIRLDEMSLCDNRNCINCVPTRRALIDEAKKVAWEQSQKRIKDGQKRKMLDAQRNNPEHCDKCDGWVSDHHVHGPADHAIFNGRVIPRPYNVPPYAEIKVHFDPVALVDVIIWEWAHPNDTAKHFFKQKVSSFDNFPRHRPIVSEFSRGGFKTISDYRETMNLYKERKDVI